MEHVITTNSLCKNYAKVSSVANLDLKIPQNSIYGFLGPNGAGKSTTLKMLIGLVKPTSGSICILGNEMNYKNRIPVLSKIGALIESPSYYAHLTGKENLEIFAALKKVDKSEISRVLDVVRLEKQADKKTGQYSLGMKQRLGIAFALLGNPEILILDEPTNGLDPAGIQEIRELIKSLPQKYDMTVLLSSHLLSEIDQMATHVGILNTGKLLFEDSLEKLHLKCQSKIYLRTLNNKLAFKLLTSKNIPCTLSEDKILLPNVEDIMLANYTSMLYQNKIPIVRIEEKSKSLEDFFLDLTGGELSL